jgi:NAD(P)-dependent dehydrogenase (short-subunit alcohol dehydrogenase family)
MTMNDRIQTDFDFSSTAADVIAGVDLTGKRAIVTGASSGIGVETARTLAAAGAEVTLAVRNPTAGDQVAQMIKTSTGGDAVVTVGQLDLADPKSIAGFLADWSGPLHILINNAGVMALPDLQLSAAGWEAHFATNHLGHFALAVGLRSALASAGGARVVSLSSNGHLLSPVVFDDINFTSRSYEPYAAYGQSKTANALFAIGVTNHWADDGILSNAVHPGAIAETNLARHMDPEVLRQLESGGTYQFKSVEQGAATSVLVATSPALEGVGGRYFEDCNQALPVDGTPSELAAMRSGVAPYARDADLAERLWGLSMSAVNG